MNLSAALRALAAAALAALLPACASSRSAAPAPVRVSPGQVAEFDGGLYQLVAIHDDFVLLKSREASGEAGALSGFLDEVFRVNRYRVGEGRWGGLERVPGLGVRWAGGEEFVLVRDDPSGTPAPRMPAMGM